DDSQDLVRKKLAAELNPNRDADQAVFHIFERLFTLSNDKAPPITSESWKLKLKQALIKMIETRSKSALTVICIEDLHWADPSTVDLFRNLLNEAALPALFLISCRPGQLAFDHRQITNPYYHVQSIQLKDLSPEKCAAMAKSLLQSEQVPAKLLAFISDQLGGNPFFLEEVVNALVDTGALTQSGTTWELSGSIGETAFSSSITALIAARLDRLGGAAKRIVQEASVIGRRFSPSILKQVAADPESVDHSLATLESLGLIMRGDDPGGDYFLFKHAIVKDVAYNSLLKKDRRNLHEKIAQVLESQNIDRIDAFCETLAYHFSNGYSIHQAVDYLKKSGRKGMKKSAYIESHDFYEKAYHLMLDGDRIAADSSLCLVELVLEWFFVFDMRGRYKDALILLRRHESAARNHVPLHLKGMYLTCLGWAYQRREHLGPSRDCLLEALANGERIHHHKVVAYACACLIWTCTAQGRLDEALAFTAKAEEASRMLESEDPSWSFVMDQDLVRFVFTGTAIAHWFRGDCRQCRLLGDRLLDYGEKAGDVNSISEGHLSHGMGCFAAGDYHGAVEKCILALESSASTIFAVNALFIKAYAHLSLDEVDQAEKHLLEILSFCKTSGCEYIATSADALSGVVAVAKGNVAVGVKALDRHARRALANGKPYHAQTIHYMLGCIFMQISMREGNLSLSMVLKNLPFFMAWLPRAAKQAEHHFITAIRITGRTNALGIKGQASLDLGRLYQAKKRKHLASPLIKESIALFEQLGADGHLKRAQAALNALV
uniref:ATP-binding protein n=1 Tax=Desulfosarcina sp. TaxID=2027861 RepID=UPI00356A22C3